MDDLSVMPPRWPDRLLTGLVGLGRSIVDYALPPRCPGCGVVVAEDRKFCVDCWQTLDFLSGPCCARCSIPMEMLLPDPAAQCGACLADPPPYEGAPAALAYGPVARRVALRLKYARRIGHARLMADLMARPFAALTQDAGMPPLLIPVPLHRWRLWSRGFNQAALVARHLAADSEADVADDLLLRRRATPSLRGLGRKARAKAVKGAFALAPDARARLAGRHVILIDDVHASGATLRACAALVVRAGPSRVSALCFARVVPGAADPAAFDFTTIDSDIGGTKDF